VARERLTGAASLPKGEARRYEVAGEGVCVVHADDGGFYAVSDLCTHEDQSLSEGWITGCEIECPRHNSIFNLKTGEAVSLPAEIPLRVYPAQLDGDDLLIEINAEDAP
jgi:nitrite reductase/ring-hydroxylating ferredoxin subunit